MKGRLRYLVAILLSLQVASCGGQTASPPARTEPATGEVAAAFTTIATPPGEASTPTAGFELRDAGLRTPESVLYDPIANVYLVSNINGGPSEQDGNGFISRVSPDGSLLDLKWIDGESGDVTLNAPKGMALSGQSLYVADIDTVRIFDRDSGKSTGEVKVDGAPFLNDVAAGADGTIYVSDTSNCRVMAIDASSRVSQFAKGNLREANGIVFTGNGLLVASANRVVTLDSAGKRLGEVDLPAGSLDGLVLLPDGTVLASSWEGNAVYRLSPAGEVTELFSGLSSPADIGFDSQHVLVLIPDFNGDRLEARPMP